MKKHNKPEWVEDIQKEKIDLRTREENQFDLLSRLYNSLTAVDTKSLNVYVFWRDENDDFYDETEEEYYDPDDFNYIQVEWREYSPGTHLDVYSNCRSPHTMVETNYELGYEHYWKSERILETEKKEVEIMRELRCYLTETDDYCIEFVTKSPYSNSSYRRTTVSSQLIDASNEEILEADKVYDIYKWLTYNTDDIPAIEIPIAGEVVSNQAAPMRMLILFGLIVIALILLSNF